MAVKSNRVSNQHAQRWDEVQVDGEASQRDVAVRFSRDGRLLALATLFRDEESLRGELAMERRDESVSAGH